MQKTRDINSVRAAGTKTVCDMYAHTLLNNDLKNMAISTLKLHSQAARVNIASGRWRVWAPWRLCVAAASLPDRPAGSVGCGCVFMSIAPTVEKNPVDQSFTYSDYSTSVGACGSSFYMQCSELAAFLHTFIKMQ